MMRVIPLFKKLVLACLAIVFLTQLSAQDREFYQLKIYTFDSDQQVKRTENYLEKAFLPALKRQNIFNVGVFKLREQSAVDSAIKLYVLIPFTTLEGFNSLDKYLAKDKIYLADGANYLQASYKAPPYKRIEVVLMSALVGMPFIRPSTIEGPRKDRIYELRSYESATEAKYTNKVEMFNAGGEIKIFEQLDFNTVFCGEVLVGANMPNLMYMTTFSNQESRDSHWEIFFASPQWETLKANPRYQNNVSHIDRIFLYPTEYSDY
jgi:hypothetical protein